MRVERDPVERFMEKVSPEPMSGCWLWTSGERIGEVRNGRSYPYGAFTMRVHGKHTRVGAHRASWMLFRGDLAPGDCVCHRCDNRFCVNPEHLFIGSQLDNVEDMLRKGRGALPPTLRGEFHGRAKLTEGDVRTIRALSATGERGTELARRYGVGSTLIYDIVHRRLWREVA